MPKVIERKFEVKKIISERTEPQIQFETEYKNLKKNKGTYSLLEYYGIGGIGKSTLLQQLVNTNYPIRNKKNWLGKYYIVWDFDSSTEIRKILTNWRNLLVKLDNHKFKFPTFEYANAVYAIKTGTTDIMISESANLIESNTILKVIIDVLSMIPLISPATQLIKTVNSSTSFLMNNTQKQKIKKLLTETDELTHGQLIDKLYIYFYEDLAECMKETDEPLVIFLDTYEKLVNSLSNIKKDDWLCNPLNGMIVNIPNVLWVIFGREKLEYNWISMGYNSKEEAENKLYLLGNLSEKESNDFLTKSSIPQNLHKKIIEFTKGNPLWLAVTIDTYVTAINRNIQFDISNIANEDGLFDRYIKYMGDEKKDIIKQLAIIGRWDNNSKNEILVNVNESSYCDILKSNLIRSENKHFFMHELIRQSIYERCKKEKYGLIEKIYNRACNYYCNILDNTNIYSLEFLSLLEELLNIYEFIDEYVYPFEKMVIYFNKLKDGTEYKKSLELATRFYKKIIYINGENSKKTFECKKLIGLIYFTNRDFFNAIPIMKSILSYSITNFGLKNKETLDIAFYLAKTYFSIKKYKNTLKIWEKYFFKNISNCYNFEMIKYYQSISYDSLEIGDICKSIELEIVIIKIILKKIGCKNISEVLKSENENTPEWLLLIEKYFILGELYYLNSNYSNAFSAIQISFIFSLFTDKKNIMNLISIKLGVIKTFLNSLSGQNYRIGLSFLLYELLKIVYLKNFSFWDINAIRNLFDMINDCIIPVLIHKNKFEHILKISNEAFKFSNYLGGINNQYTLTMLNRKKDSLVKLKKYKNVIQTLFKIISIQKKVNGKNYPEILQNLISLAINYKAIRNKTKEIKYLQQAYRFYKQNSKNWLFTFDIVDSIILLFNLSDKNIKQELIENLKKEYESRLQNNKKTDLSSELKYITLIYLQVRILDYNSGINSKILKLLIKADNVATKCYKMRNFKLAIRIENTINHYCKKKLSENNYYPLLFSTHLSEFYAANKYYGIALQLSFNNYEICKLRFNKTNNLFIKQLYNICIIYSKYNEDLGGNEIIVNEVAKRKKDFLELYENVLGENHKYITNIKKIFHKKYIYLSDIFKLKKTEIETYLKKKLDEKTLSIIENKIDRFNNDYSSPYLNAYIDYFLKQKHDLKTESFLDLFYETYIYNIYEFLIPLYDTLSLEEKIKFNDKIEYIYTITFELLHKSNLLIEKYETLSVNF